MGARSFLWASHKKRAAPETSRLLRLLSELRLAAQGLASPLLAPLRSAFGLPPSGASSPLRGAFLSSFPFALLFVLSFLFVFLSSSLPSLAFGLRRQVQLGLNLLLAAMMPPQRACQARVV